MTTAIKVCGITSVADAELAVECGAAAIGLNFWSASPRSVDVRTARAIVDAVGARTLVVGVFVDAPIEVLLGVKRDSGVACVQLHGDEPPEVLDALLPHAYKALRVRGPEIAEEARRYGGRYLLLDAYSPVAPGGTGETFDWRLASELAHQRRLTLAGGLTADNVGEAILRVRPYCVDVASGVEHASASRKKDPSKMRAFVTAVRDADARLLDLQ